ncbi:MAG TPA: SGNH/GDSL hydrolase family protein [Tepidisphaeraceae bacterium]|nr:SGNH/GDSL hydrolase family protein [Tepidisphaeraceae bacterium]
MRFILASLILLIGAEVVLRTVFGLGHPLLYQSDADCGYFPKPNQHLWRFFCTNDINQFGMRSSPVQSPKPKDEFRVFFLGDSVLFGMTHVDQSKICTTILQRELPGQLHRPVEVLNASAGGWAVPNEVGYLHSRGTFNADLVVFVVNTYDMVQPFNDLIPGTVVEQPIRNPPTAIGELWSRYLKPRLFHVTTADRGSSEPLVPDQKAAVASTLGWLEKARRQCEASGARFAIIYTPVVGSDFRPLPELLPLRKQLGDWAQSANVPLLDMTEEDSKHPGREVFFDIIHLNPLGQQIMARAVEQWSVVRSYSKS